MACRDKYGNNLIAEEVLEMAIPCRPQIIMRIYGSSSDNVLTLRPVLYDMDDNELPVDEQKKYGTKLFLEMMNRQREAGRGSGQAR